MSVEGNFVTGANTSRNGNLAGIVVRDPGYSVVSVTNNTVANSHNGISVGRDVVTGLTIEYNDLRTPQSNEVAFRNNPFNPRYSLSNTNLIGNNTLINADYQPLSPDMGGGSASWDMGTLQPTEIDSLTGQRWNFGTVTRSGLPGTSVIDENIGGDDANDRAQFTVSQGVALNLHTEGAIAQVINATTNSVVASSGDSYFSELSTLLAPGTYILSYRA
ncbi:MAG TPA: hypothetical protein DDW76_36590 [Cyanobacteria bacterium UBA11369]|nr:hypothetical protein [Cyanobacteria bacterium UBA11368]HBE54125.1 hypothetical protein [Cyanobacteria bacterium UBA11369]